MKKKNDKGGFHGFVLLESSIGLGILCLVMMSLLPIIVEMKEQTTNYQRRTEAARLCYESSQLLMKETDEVFNLVTNDGRDYHIHARMTSHEKAQITITLKPTATKWIIYEK